MLTSRPPLSPRLLAIRQAVARGDYSCLAAGGERLVFEYAKRCGVGAAELLHEWAGHDARARGKAAEVLEQTVPKPARIETESRDLDYWADDVAPVEPDDDDDGQPCAVCDGRGKDAAGNVCTACNGSGKAPIDDDNEDKDDEEE
jgi:hypothetical protein